MYSKKDAALAWYNRCSHLNSLHKQKVKIQADISEFCKNQAQQDDYGKTLRVRDSIAHKHSAGVQYHGGGRAWFVCFLNMVFETEPEFFRSDDDKKDFALSHFTTEEVKNYRARNELLGYRDDWRAVRRYLNM
ncbi:hypothetical protein OC846_000480 [Tilletia horrida]|uniref:Uncharacterized protein n=1 Tax=Tilletia horrida TaxID=155126 RepID=A0AAN6JUJ1_9BASI|nr:hypothetical protein OC845_001118 [Tilletia horrida]KAK0557492.1 hypothetical protein OC846_000480 [Tilletia horrida]KAK0567891.1 hypothetical protein OC861_002451 [Tilletia horrida]